MHSLYLASIIQREREREIAHALRVRAVRAARAGEDDAAFVPPPEDRPRRITHARRLTPAAGPDV